MVFNDTSRSRLNRWPQRFPLPDPTVAVIGGINRDEVHTIGCRTRHGWGGILYNIEALRRFGPRGLRVLPVAYVGIDAQRSVGRRLRQPPVCDSRGLVPVDYPGNLCRLHYGIDGRRQEQLVRRVPALTYRHLGCFRHVDLALFNFVSGRDVTPAALQRFRDEGASLVYIDLHSYLLGCRRDGARFQRRPRTWRRLIACADILQMNEDEFKTLTGLSPDTVTAGRWAAEVLAPMPCRCVLVTLGAAGALCLTRGRTRWSVASVGPQRRCILRDPTGAGDTFTGAWIACWLRNGDAIGATRFAVRQASRPARR